MTVEGCLADETLPIDPTVALARQIDKEAGRSLIPVLVIHTANASAGSAMSDL